MKIEFNQGVPRECVRWLWDNLGTGNLSRERRLVGGNVIRIEPLESDAWFYERVKKPKTPEAFGDDPFVYVPTITVYDEKIAILFALRWG